MIILQVKLETLLKGTMKAVFMANYLLLIMTMITAYPEIKSEGNRESRKLTTMEEYKDEGSFMTDTSSEKSQQSDMDPNHVENTTFTNELIIILVIIVIAAEVCVSWGVLTTLKYVFKILRILRSNTNSLEMETISTGTGPSDSLMSSVDGENREALGPGMQEL